MTVIKPKNIYYMLSYAYRVLKEDGFSEIASEEFDNIHNLFAEIIYLGVSHQIKRGLIREYKEVTESIGTVRGRINIRESFRGIEGHSNKLTCTFDEYSLDTQMNRILKTTMTLLLCSDDVKHEKKIQLKTLLKYFDSVEIINPHTIHWDTLRYHRNNATYKMLMHLCHLILTGMLLSETPGNYRLANFLEEDAMHRLYERFIFEFFKREFPEFSVARDVVQWNIDEASSLMRSLLPEMRTDITLHYQNKTLIIDAKYYAHILSSSQYSDVGKFHSGNLYQIFTYVKNMDKENTGNVSGMLLYAMTEEDFMGGATASMGGNQISVEVLNLGGEWKEIEGKLRKIGNDMRSENV